MFQNTILKKFLKKEGFKIDFEKCINNKKIEEVTSIEVIADKGVVGDRHLKDYNDPYCQLSLIESENIDYYNTKYGLNISYVDFRRNVITKEIELNNLIGKKFFIGKKNLLRW